MDYYATLYLIALFFLIGIMILLIAWREPEKIYIAPAYDYGYQPIRRLDYNPWYSGKMSACVGCGPNHSSPHMPLNEKRYDVRGYN